MAWNVFIPDLCHNQVLEFLAASGTQLSLGLGLNAPWEWRWIPRGQPTL